MKILVVVDMQNDFIAGPLGTPEAREIVPKVKEKIQEYVRNEYPIIFTRDTHFDNYYETIEGKKLPVKHCVYNTIGWAIYHDLVIPITYKRILLDNKFTFGSNHLPGIIQHYINGWDVKEIEIVGVCTDICVVSNALLLKAYFYQNTDITVDATCCAGTTPEMHEAALKVMESCQIDVKRG